MNIKQAIIALIRRVWNSISGYNYLDNLYYRAYFSLLACGLLFIGMSAVKSSLISLSLFLTGFLASLSASQATPVPPVVNPPHPFNNTVINFTNYKVTNGRANTNWKAMILALQACQQSHAATLNIPRGTYTFDDPSILTFNGGGHIQLSNLTDLTINGNGSTFIFHYVRNGFDFYNCQRVLLENLTVEWDFDIAVPGTVKSLNGSNVIVVNSAYPITASTPVGAVTEYDTANMKWQMNAQEIYNPSNVKLIAPQTLSSPDFSMFPVGDTVAVRTYVYAARGFEFSFNNNADLTFNAITVENCPGMAFVGYGSDRGFKFDSCVIQRRNTTHDLVSTGADGIHIGMSHGDTVIQNCDFSYLGDDAVNVHSIWMTVVSKTNNNTAKIATIVYDPTYVKAGDTFQFFSKANLTSLGQANVTSVSYNATTQQYTLTFAGTLPSSLPAGSYVTNLARSSNRATIANNYFHDHRARGILVQSQEVSITNNHIQNVMGAAVQLTTDIADWNEGCGCANVVVTGNLCEGCNYGYWGGFNNLPGVCLGVINLFSQTPQGLNPTCVHQNITISNNTVSNTPDIAFFIGSAQNVSLTNNTIQNCSASASQGIYVSRAAQVTITGNHAINCSLTPNHGVYVQTSTTSNIMLAGNAGF
jgi:hypothetical protein